MKPLLIFILLFASNVSFTQNCDSIRTIYYDKFQQFTRLESKKHLDLKYDMTLLQNKYAETNLMAFPKEGEKYKAIDITFNIFEYGKNVFIPTSSSGAYILFEDNTSLYIKLSEMDLGHNTSANIHTVPFEGEALYDHLKKYKVTAIRIIVNLESRDYDLKGEQQNFFKDFIKCYENYFSH